MAIQFGQEQFICSRLFSKQTASEGLLKIFLRSCRKEIAKILEVSSV